MGQALYRKYRSRSLSEIVGQDHITKTLGKALKEGRISHAYLFTGPRGVGKTSVARIIAHEANKLPYTDESMHLDIIEIDAASNRRIDEIRDLRERVHIAPTSAKYKVYIIDEVHMLTREAFNALLKTLEEPPAHCIFILATTEAHKLPETIISRTQRFSFKPVSAQQAAEHLKMIAKKEGIKIEPQALAMLAEHGDGSFRDSISLLDQLSSTMQPITVQSVQSNLGIPPGSVIDRLVERIVAGDIKGCLQSLADLREQGINAAAVAKSLAQRLRNMLLDNQDSAWIAALLRLLLEVPASSQPQDNLEVAVLEAASQLASHASSDGAGPDQDTKATTKRGETPDKKPPTVHDRLASPPKSAKATNSKFDIADWPKVVEMVKSEAASLYTALRLASPSVEDGNLILAFQFPLHQKKVSQAKAKDLIGKTIEQIGGSSLPIQCIVDKSVVATIETDEPIVIEDIPDVADGPMTTISNIFGGAEVLES